VECWPATTGRIGPSELGYKPAPPGRYKPIQDRPRVIHVETKCAEPVATVLAPDFESFTRGLVDCSRYDEADA